MERCFTSVSGVFYSMETQAKPFLVRDRVFPRLYYKDLKVHIPIHGLEILLPEDVWLRLLKYLLPDRSQPMGFPSGRAAIPAAGLRRLRRLQLRSWSRFCCITSIRQRAKDVDARCGQGWIYNIIPAVSPSGA